MTPYIEHPKPYWLRHLVRDHRLSSAEGESLAEWSHQFATLLEGLETEKVYYLAASGDVEQAINEFGRLLRSCHRNAKAQDKNLVGWCKSRIIYEASQQMQRRVLEYLPEMLDDSDSVSLLREVVNQYGWSKRIK